MDWDTIQGVLALWRRERVSTAARDLGVSEQTLRRRLADLEAGGCGAVFERVDGRLVPTITGRRLVDAALAMEAIMPSTAATPRAIDGRVRITATELLALEVLPGAFADLRRRHPRLTITLGVTYEDEDVLRGETDIAVRPTRPTSKAVVTRPASGVRLGLFAHRDYLARAGTPQSPDDLSRFELVGAGGFHDPAVLLARAGFAPPFEAPHLRTTSEIAAVAAVGQGLGIGVCVLSVAERRPELIRLLPQIEDSLTLWVCMHEDQRGAPAVRAAFDAIVRVLDSPAAAPRARRARGAASREPVS